MSGDQMTTRQTGLHITGIAKNTIITQNKKRENCNDFGVEIKVLQQQKEQQSTVKIWQFILS
jgi:hypothetical protein